METTTKGVDEMTNGVKLIAKERKRQINKERYDVVHDAEYCFSEIARAAACYAIPQHLRQLNEYGIPVDWPWNNEHWKPTPLDRIRELAKSGALIAAEIDRMESSMARVIQRRSDILDESEDQLDAVTHFAIYARAKRNMKMMRPWTRILPLAFIEWYCRNMERWTDETGNKYVIPFKNVRVYIEKHHRGKGANNATM